MNFASKGRFRVITIQSGPQLIACKDRKCLSNKHFRFSEIFLSLSLPVFQWRLRFVQPRLIKLFIKFDTSPFTLKI